ncbi:MAG: HlyD family efflux transporter periplasmic adaptor subunit [Clostridia bacterium]|nr:HlyD family efflux transporter periplasmic adaptor subunit [Clostridia bacterium]
MKKFRKTLIAIIVIIAISSLTFYIGRQIGLNTDMSSTNTTVEEKIVGTRTITKTLTSSGEISTSNTEKLEISTTKYFETMCVEEDDTVKIGENILKYTDGTYLVAPYDCVISSYSVPETLKQATSSNYIEVKNLKDLTISLNVSENEISNISVDKEVQITLTADTSKIYTGKITKINSVGTYGTSGTTFAVTVAFENDGVAKLGMSVSCEIKIDELTDVVAVPINGVQENGSKKYVIVIENGEEKEVQIQTGLSDDEYVQVTEGLKGGETIKVVTTTKQNTVRNTNKSSSGNGDKNFGNGSSNGGQRGNMNSKSGSGAPSEGSQGMPNMPNNK